MMICSDALLMNLYYHSTYCQEAKLAGATLDVTSSDTLTRERERESLKS